MDKYRFPVIDPICTGGIGNIGEVLTLIEDAPSTLDLGLRKTKNQKKRARKAARKDRKANNKQ